MSDDSEDMELNFKGKIYPEHKDWPTIEKKVKAALKELAKDNLYTSTDISGSGGEGQLEIREEMESEEDDPTSKYKGYVYYAWDDKKEGRAFAELVIHFGTYTDPEVWTDDPKQLNALGKKVAEAMKAQGLKPSDPEGVDSLVVTL